MSARPSAGPSKSISICASGLLGRQVWTHKWVLFAFEYKWVFGKVLTNIVEMSISGV